MHVVLHALRHQRAVLRLGAVEPEAAQGVQVAALQQAHPAGVQLHDGCSARRTRGVEQEQRGREVSGMKSTAFRGCVLACIFTHVLHAGRAGQGRAGKQAPAKGE